MKRAADDPFKDLTALIQNIGGKNGMQPVPGFGKIISPPPDLKIAYNGMTIDKKYLYVDEYWVQNHERHAKGKITSATQNRAGGGGEAAFESHNHDIDNPYTDNIIYTDTWKVGDIVMLLPITAADDKTVVQFAVFGKWIRLDGV